MRAHKCLTAGLTVLALLAIAAHSADAQTTAVGPYYATPSWDQTIACTSTSACPRFVVLSNFANQAVLDRETGLVWQRTPNQTSVSWLSATQDCRSQVIAHRAGWRLPNADEFESLLDDSSGGSLTLPPGHPFQGVTSSAFYWTETSREGATDNDGLAYVMGFSSQFAPVGAFIKMNAGPRTWCVRGPGGVPSQ